MPPQLTAGHSREGTAASRLSCAIPSESWKHLARTETGVGRPLEKKRSFSASLLPSQHTLVHGGATGSLLQTLCLCNRAQLLVLAFPPPPELPALQGRRAGICAQCLGGEAEPVSLKALSSSAAAVRSSPTPGTDVVAGDATRAGKGCDGLRAAVKGPVKEIPFEKKLLRNRADDSMWPQIHCQVMPALVQKPKSKRLAADKGEPVFRSFMGHRRSAEI